MDIKNMSAEELVKLAQEKGIELGEDQLDAISGGRDWDEIDAPAVRCGICGRETYYYESEGKPNYCQFCGASY